MSDAEDKARIAAELAVANDPDTAARRNTALAEGYKDEHCPKCGTLCMAHHHFIRCAAGDCPMRSKDGKSLLDLIGGDK